MSTFHNAQNQVQRLNILFFNLEIIINLKVTLNLKLNTLSCCIGKGHLENPQKQDFVICHNTAEVQPTFKEVEFAVEWREGSCFNS